MSAPGPRSNPGPRNSMPPARSGASGASRVPRRPGAPSDPSSRAFGGGNGNGGGSGPRSRPPVAGGPGDYDGPSSSGRQRARSNGRPLTGDTPPGGRTGSGQRRSMADMARDLSRTMSRQLGAMVARTRGPAYESPPAPRMAPPRRSPMPTSLPPDVTAKLHAQAYRRSRIRLVARKWRLGRVRPNPVAYFAVVLITAVLAVAIAFGGGAGLAYAINYYNSHLADIQAIANLKNADNSSILDRNGSVIATLKGTSDFNFYAPLSQVSDKLQWATIDTEDHTFWNNVGIDFQATLRAAFVDVQAGGANQGASSITQQLVKNIVLKDSNKTYIRKLDEAILAYGLTQQYTKAQILEMYLNEVYYSGLYKGVEAAARYFFNLKPYPQVPNNPKSPEILANQQLTWGQAALLAALPNNPTIFLPTDYSCTSAPCPQNKWDWPFADPVQPCGAYVDTFWTSEWYLTHGHEWLVYCRVTTAVLPSLVTYGGTGITFTKADSDQAAAEVQTMLEQQQVHPFQQVITNSGDSGQATNLAPHFVEFVANEMSDKFGVGSLETAGLRIYTTLDLNLNRYVQQQIHYYIDEPYKNPWYPSGGCGYSGGIALDCPLSQASNANDGAAVAIDQHTGDIRAMVGSADYNNNDPRVAGKLNVTTHARSMGSATKPLVYVTALQMGWTPGIMLQDIPICFPQDGQTPNDPAKACGKHYTPLNYEATKFAGTMPLRYMLGNSLNIPATEAMAFVG
ncbi:MAG TPA: transglycosylase domain-containing protein, partial [Ktedonobacterales bacterium]|nr:transglycosylase domain-containing protein [Ktedonobacterales bacterium]